MIEMCCSFKRKFLVIASCLMLLSFSMANGASEPWTVERMMEVKNVGDVEVSPDGNKVLFTVTGAVMTEEKSEYLTQVFVAGADGSGAVQFTRGEKSSTNPSWSPDGRWIAFTSSRGGENNIWLIPADGGEAYQLTGAKTGIGAYKWSPDGGSIVYECQDAPSEEEELKSKGGNDARVLDHDIKQSHLWIVPVACGDGKIAESVRLTEGDFYATGDVSWSVDGENIVFSHTPAPGGDNWLYSDISTVDLESKIVSPLLNSAAAEMSPFYSPDGKWLAFVRSDEPTSWGVTRDVCVVRLGDGKLEALTRTTNRNVHLVGWSADSRKIYCSEIQGTVNRLFTLDLKGSEPEYLDIGDNGRLARSPNLNLSGTHLGFSLQATDMPVEAYVASLHRFAPVKVSNANAVLSDVVTARTETINWKSVDGLEIEGLLTYPDGYEQGRSYPLLLVIHGGPMGVFTRSFIAGSSPYPVAAFAAEGFMVLRCNIRGSNGYGRDFRYANYGDWGGMDYQDLMTGVDNLIELGLADPERLGVMGWSYGGYMSSWIISQTDRFKAASIGAPVTNLMSFTGTTDINSFLPDYFDCEYWENLAAYSDHSAMFNIGGASTPSLIQHGEKDIRVPFGQGQELYNALKRQGIEVKMVAYPREGHGLGEPKHRLDAASRNLQWFKRHLNQ